MESRVVFIASLYLARSFDSFTMQWILVSETTAITQTKSQVDPRTKNRDYPVTEVVDGQTDGFSALYSR